MHHEPDSRSLKWTIASIQGFLFAPLDAARVEYDVYFHHYADVTKISSHRSGELTGVPVSSAADEALLLGPRVKRWSSTNQSSFDYHLDHVLVPEIRKHLSKIGLSREIEAPRGFDSIDLRNVFRQLNSIREVTRLWESHPEQYACVLYLRPDLKYIDSLNVGQLLGVGSTQYLTPLWSTYGGCNDRIGAGKPHVMLAFGKRLDFVIEYFRSGKANRLNERSYGGLHPETFLRWVIVEKYGFHRVGLHLRGLRVRSNGVVDHRDWTLVPRSERSVLIRGTAQEYRWGKKDLASQLKLAANEANHAHVTVMKKSSPPAVHS